MSALALFTAFHVIVSLLQLIAGLAMVFSFITKHPVPTVARAFLVTTAITLATGFLFPFHGVTPAIVIGMLNVAILAATWFALARSSGSRLWDITYTVGTIALLYFDCLVLIVQSFQKLPPLHAMAPVGNEPAVLASQTVLLILAVVAGYLSLRRVRHAV